jgi:preprotein translocase subunit SecG
MNWVNLLIVVHVLVALAIIGLVLLQHGKGADMGSGFGGGASGSLFGATGSANFLSRTTAVLATIFFILSLALAYLATKAPVDTGGGGVMDAVRKEQPAKKEEQKAAEETRPKPQGKEVPQ